MASLRRFAVSALLCFFAGAAPAVAVPVEVVYEFDSGVGFAGWGVGATTAMGVADAQLTVRYDDGSPVIGGFVASPATVQLFVLTFTSSGTLMGDPFPRMAAGSGPVGTLSVGGFWNFFGPTLISASAVSPGFPTYSQSGSAFFVIEVFGPGSIGLSGGGTQMFVGPSLTASWTLGGAVGMEVSRTVVPEPASGLLAALGLAGLAGGAGWRRSRRSGSTPRPRMR